MGLLEKSLKKRLLNRPSNCSKKYVTKKWYPGHRDTGWYDLHKENIDNYYGYWSFESGALCKLKDLDYKELEGVPYFPYDLVAEGATK